jgi:transcriptional regulatory protein LevR
MKPKQIVKSKVLLNKVADYFATHPTKESVVVKVDLGESKVYWRAVRESPNRISVTEVKTVTESFVFEVEEQAPAKKTAKAKAPAVEEKPLMTIKMVTAAQ